MKHIIPDFEKINIPLLSYFHVYFDLGTANTRISIKDKGIVLSEPTILGYNKKIHEYIFFGKEAKQVVGKVPDYIEIQRPIINSVISNFDGEAALLRTCVQRSVFPYVNKFMFLKPAMAASAAVPSTATEIELKAVEEVLYKIGMSHVSLYEKQLVTALGCGLDIFLHNPVFLIDMGAGLITLSIVSGGGVVTEKTLKNAGDHMNKLIYNYVYFKHALVLGESTCEEIKITLLNYVGEEKSMTVRGKSLETGLPKTAKIKTSDVKEAVSATMQQIADTAKEVIELSPPEMVDEIFKHGIILTGGMATIPGIETYLGKELDLTVKKSEQKEHATINGLVRLARRKEHARTLKIRVP